MATKKKAKKTTAASKKTTATSKKTAKRAKPAAKRGTPKKVAKRAAPKRAAAKRAAPKRAAPKRAPSKKKATAGKAPAAARAKAVQRRDRPGHIDPRYAAELLGRGEHERDPEAFVARPRSEDDLVEELAEEFVESATTGEPVAEDVANQDVPEERGGPFVRTTAGREFAEGTDESNPEDATREPFPLT